MQNVNHHADGASAGGNITSLLVEADDGDRVRKITVTGRDAWAPDQLMKTGEKGCTPITNPAPRWSHYVFKLHGEGLEIETVPRKARRHVQRQSRGLCSALQGPKDQINLPRGEPAERQESFPGAPKGQAERGGGVSGARQLSANDGYVLSPEIIDSDDWRGLTASERVVYVALAVMCNKVGGAAVPLSALSAAKQCNISKNTAARALQGLQSFGLIRRGSDSRWILNPRPILAPSGLIYSAVILPFPGRTSR